MTADPDAIAVEFTVSNIRHVHDAGRLLALATVTIELAGIEIALNGVQVRRLPNGKLRCQAPQFRTHTGTWEPAVTMPEELEEAIGREVLTAGGFMDEGS